MRNILTNLGIIISIHIVWFCLFVILSLQVNISNDLISALSYFFVEPIFMYVVYPAIVYMLEIIIFKHRPWDKLLEKNIVIIGSIIGSIICTAFVICFYFFNDHLMCIEENGFES